jgi:transducin (beta)-like 1
LIEYTAEATACAFNPKDSTLIASCSSDGKISVHQSQKLLYTFEYEAAEVTCLQWSPDGKLLMAGTFGGNTRIWNIAKDGELLHVLSHGSDAPVLAAKFHPRNSHILATVHSNCVQIWIDSVEALKLSDHKDVAMDLDWHHSRDALATCSKDKSVLFYLFDISLDQSSNEVSGVSIKEHLALNGHFDDVNAVRWCPHDPEVLASCSDDTTVILWKPFQGSAEEHRFPDHNQEIYALEWNPKEPLLATYHSFILIHV